MLSSLMLFDVVSCGCLPCDKAKEVVMHQPPRLRYARLAVQHHKAESTSDHIFGTLFLRTV